MNREIKFRVWHKKNLEYFYFEPFNKLLPSFSGESSYHYYYSLSNFYCGISKSLNMEPVDIEDIISQQFTGFLDKNGKEIYEGDIIKCGVYEDWFAKEKTYFDKEVKFDICKSGESDIAGYIYIPDDREIIGNIFENPELIK